MLGQPASPLLWSINGDSPAQSSLAAWCAYTGQSQDNVEDWGWLAALPPSRRDSVRDAWNDAALVQKPFTLAYYLRHLSKGYHAFTVLHVPLFTEQHQLQAWLVFFVKKPAKAPETDQDWELRLIYGMIFTQKVLGILLLSLDGSIIRANARLGQLTGYSEEELHHLTIWQLCVPDDVHLHLQAMRERLQSDQSYPPFRVRYLRKDGTSTWGRTTQFLVRHPSGEPYYFFHVIEDVNTQVQSEVERAELLARVQEAHNEALARTLQLETIFETITDGILVSDREGYIIQSNTAVHRIFHLDAYPEYLKLPYQQRARIMTLVNEYGQQIPPEEWPIPRLLRGELLHESRLEDIRMRLPDGQENYLSFAGAPIFDQEMQIAGAVLVIHDVNERHLLESRIRKSFKILLALAEVLVDLPERHRATAASTNQQRPVPSFRATGEYLAALTCQMLEYQGVSISRVDEEMGLHMVAIAGSTGESRSAYYKRYANVPLAALLDEEAIIQLQANEVVVRSIATHVSTSSPYTILFAPMIREGQLVGALSLEKKEEHLPYTLEEASVAKAIAKFILLVMERERMQREWIEAHSSELALREANQRFDEFLSIASHELRTPLAGIKGNLQLAIRRLKALNSHKLSEMEELMEKLDKTIAYLKEAEDRVNVQNRMISDLLDVSRIQANKLEMLIGPCDLHKVVCDAVKDQRRSTPERTIILNVPCGEPFMVVGDADRLGQVVHNYLSNALKYSPTYRPVSVDIERQDNTVRVSVHDQGSGLTPEEQKRVWERFYRVKGTTTQAGSSPGLGLGLHISRRIIDAHHGQSGLESAPGKGSTFWFTLPLEQSAPAPSEQVPGPFSQRISDSPSIL